MVYLPKFAALKSKYNNKYLRYVNEKSSPVRTFLQYSGDEILTPFTKFEFEKAQSDPSSYHIKCCYNNKYLVSASSSDHHYIVAGADQKQEDKSKWTCTLFRPTYDNYHQSFRFSHVYLGSHVVLWRFHAPYGECLRAQSSYHTKDHPCDLNMVINMESLIALPKFLAFTGDNGLYLREIKRGSNNVPYLQFGSSSVDDSTIRMESFITKDGSTRFKSSHSGKFWRCDHTSNYFVILDYSTYDNDNNTQRSTDTLFSPTQISPNVVALRNLGNGNFVKRYSSGNDQNFLFAERNEIDAFAHLRMTELVRSREIFDVAFHLSDAKIHNQSVVALATKSATNGTGKPTNVKLNIPYTNTSYCTWTSIISTKQVEVKTVIKSEVPLIVDGKIFSTASDYFGEYKWGETISESENTNGITHEATVPPMSNIIGTLYATKGSFDIPFSYKQSDILFAGNNNNPVEFSLDDGVYHGTNYYNFQYDIKIVPISTSI
ncbi:uncharacterized protein E5676_scaffold266G00970 [Cucumis melo var. makuwa]|uniref:Agglutinin domain-containing protein n=1 Tax=Cucumis melo var. makuwa TaxID=1194695 RepID=A0A5D3DM06_CUCMM|nr:uncharacterized protein E6C27_scaffold122G002310 [Cucumis melo var. makuwa]TYK24552.1 uncharacterized protein E5676_scaffold266G00970 [Cucumis melo var. makuwa]